MPAAHCFCKQECSDCLVKERGNSFYYNLFISKIFYLCRIGKQMKCRLVKIDSLSGNRASVYSVLIDVETETLLEKFVRKNISSFLSETKDILKHFRIMRH